MLAYAAHRRQRRKARPATLTLIVGAHAVALGLLISAKMDVGTPFHIVRTELRNIPLPKDPPPPPEKPIVEPKVPPVSQLDTPPVKVEVPLDVGPTIVPLPTPPLPGPLVGPSVTPVPVPPPLPLPRAPKVVKLAQLATPADLLKPPYPEAKRRLEEEAVLKLRLAIDPSGRVTSVEPAAAADPAFLAAARQHLIRYWRYKPATEDGRAVASTLTVSLRFELEE